MFKMPEFWVEGWSCPESNLLSVGGKGFLHSLPPVRQCSCFLTSAMILQQDEHSAYEKTKESTSCASRCTIACSCLKVQVPRCLVWF
jgi:hypothetical protein